MAERVCYDPYAIQFAGRLFYAFLKFFVSIGYSERKGPGVMDFLVARTRYLDDYLQVCVDDGIQQLVILGAGFDSRAYRYEALRERVKVFEVDHPASQQAKIAKLKQIFGRVPEHVTYVPVDFNHETLEKLLGCGYEAHTKTLFIWEGVTYYITAEAVDRTLAFVTEHSGAGSSIIFDYTYSTVIEGTQKRGEMTSARRYARFTGEGWNFGIPEGTVETFLEQHGFYKVTNATSEDFKRLYFTGVNQKREAAPVYAIVHATVKPR